MLCSIGWVCSSLLSSFFSQTSLSKVVHDDSEYPGMGYHDGDEVVCELNMKSTPHTLHFFVNGTQIPYFFQGFNTQHRFAVCSSFSYLSILRIQITAQGADNAFELSWIRRTNHPTSKSVPGETSRTVSLPS